VGNEFLLQGDLWRRAHRTQADSRISLAGPPGQRGAAAAP